jgi:KipI family sensor histidine kinase inhibitor
VNAIDPSISALGDSAITITLAEVAAPASTAYARAAARALRAANLAHVEEVVAAYTAVTVFFDALHASTDEVSNSVREILRNAELAGSDEAQTRLHTVRTVYDGPDLDDVAAATGLRTVDVIEIHSSRTYDVDLLGFVPGFAYLSELDARLELPRRATPRQRVPAGSVAVASRLTGLYPFDTPGGWHLIGKTDALLFDPRRPEPSLFKPGDKVRFEPAG